MPSARTAVWLDELQRYLGQGEGLAAGTVRTLIRAGAVLVGTMWPDEYDARFAARHPGSGDPHAEDRELLDLAQVFDVADTFTAAEHARARACATADGRVRVALDSANIGLTQVLAAGPQLVRWWEQAPNPYAKALITATVDTRRVGVGMPVTAEFLADAAPGYLSPAERATAADDWLQRALAYATTPLHGAASALAPVDDGTMGQVAGYIAADYLFQHGLQTRRTERLPEEAWLALIDHVHTPQDVDALAHSAEQRLLYRYAESLYRRLSIAGRPEVAEDLVALLIKGGKVEEAIGVLGACAQAGDRWAITRIGQSRELREAEQLRLRAEAGDSIAAWQLCEILWATGRDLESLAVARELIDSGDADAAALFHSPSFAHILAEVGLVDKAIGILAGAASPGAASPGDEYARRLAKLLRNFGRIDQLRDRADSGDWHAARILADALGHLGNVAELSSRATNGDNYAASELARLLAGKVCVEDAIEVQRERADAGDRQAASDFAKLLDGQDRIETLRGRADIGDDAAANQLAWVLYRQRDLAELRQRATNGDWSSTERMVALLALEGDEAALRAEVDGGTFQAWISLALVLIQSGRTREATSLLRYGFQGPHLS